MQLLGDERKHGITGVFNGIIDKRMFWLKQSSDTALYAKRKVGECARIEEMWSFWIMIDMGFVSG
jgi:hypothetical protein